MAMSYMNSDLVTLIAHIDLGSTVAEDDTLLETAKVETSVFFDLLFDKVDLIPGTKGSGKSALFRIFVEFLPDLLLEQQKAVIAHGVTAQGDSVFNAYKSSFEKLSEDDFVNFWCIYCVSLVHEQFIKNDRYARHLRNGRSEIDAFLRSCADAHIPEIKAKKSYKDVIEWTLAALSQMNPRVKVRLPQDSGEYVLELFGNAKKPAVTSQEDYSSNLPRYMHQLRDRLDAILEKASLNVWLMIDRLDDIFPRRSTTERLALRGLLRAMRVFSSKKIRFKVFLRDDMLDEVVSGPEGFAGLTHVAARKSETLRWSEDDILTLIVRRLFTCEQLLEFLRVDRNQLTESQNYRRQLFYRVFPQQVYKGTRQSDTLRWIYRRTADGNGVVTPRDVIDLVTKAKQRQHSDLLSNRSGESQSMISSQAIQHGLSELSKGKRTNYLLAEFPHLWGYIEKLERGKAENSERHLKRLWGSNWRDIAKDLRSIGLMSESLSGDTRVYTVPFLYREGLEITQGRAD